MQRSQFLAIVLVLAAAVVGLLYLTPEAATPTGSGENGSAQATPSDTEPAVGETVANGSTTTGATDTTKRTLVAQPKDAPAIEGTNVLRVVFEGLTDESAANAFIKVATYDKGRERTARIQESWQSQGTTNEFGLDQYLALVAERFEEQRFDELKVVVEHPLYLRETIHVPATAGVKSSSGQTVYEARVKFAEVAYWPELKLMVRDSVTKKHLQDVELRCVPTAFMGLHQQPGKGSPFSILGSGLTSPVAMFGGRKVGESEQHVAGIALRPKDGDSRRTTDLSQPEENARGVMVYARAPGYAWGRIVLDLSKGTERELLLGPSTTLQLRFANVQLAEYAKLEKPATICVTRIQPNGDVSGIFYAKLDETLAKEGVQVEGLEPGEHTVSVEIGHAFTWRKRHVLAREKVELLAGKQREVMLMLADSPGPPQLVSLGGAVSFPTFVGEKNVRLWLYKADYNYGNPDFEVLLADMEPAPGALPTWSFRLESMPVGRYQARLMPFEKNWMFEIPPGGRDDLELIVPKLAEVIVETVHAKTGERIPLKVIRFTRHEELKDRIHNDWSSQRNATRSESEPGRFRIWAAPGPASLRTYGLPSELGLAHRTQEIELTPGLQHVRFELGPRYTIKFDFRVNGATLPRDEGIYYGIAKTVRAIGHDGKVGYLSYWMLQATKPGLYEISFEGIGKGRFQPIPPRRIEVKAGETTEVVVDLQRQ